MSKRIFKSGNPTLNDRTFERFGQDLPGPGSYSDVQAGDRMTIAGTVNKSYLLLAVIVGAGAISWHFAMAAGSAAGMAPWLIGASLIGLALAIAIVSNPRLASSLSFMYAAFEGLLLGGISAAYELQHPGMVLQAVGLTVLVLFAMLVMYSTGYVRATERFRTGLIAAMLGILMLYLIDLVLILGFHMPIPMIHQSSPLGIGFSIFVVIIAALNLVLDFDTIQRGVEQRLPKYAEWYCAFGLMVTLVWLYLEILRLVAKSRR